ncbi:glycine cleavage system H-protein subunit [Coemansia sp. RSA 2618]|nr:glycine cleavage system H-protein subunit [Coemansia sp. RSA 2618]
MLGVLRTAGSRCLPRAIHAARASMPLVSGIRNYVTKYTESHEWVRIDGDVATIGVTDYAQNALGDVVYVEVPEVDMEVEVEDVVGIVESVKSTSDIYTPLAGTIVEANQNVVTNTKLINKSPESDGWLFKIKFSDKAQLDTLLDAAKYKSLIEDGH